VAISKTHPASDRDDTFENSIFLPLISLVITTARPTYIQREAELSWCENLPTIVCKIYLVSLTATLILFHCLFPCVQTCAGSASTQRKVELRYRSQAAALDIFLVTGPLCINRYPERWYVTSQNGLRALRVYSGIPPS